MKVRLERVQSVIGTFQLFVRCGHVARVWNAVIWNLNLNETKQTKMKHKQILSVLCNAPCFAVRFLFVSLSVGECSFFF